MEDVLQQLRLPQFHVPFLGSVPEDERDALLLNAANTLQIEEIVDNYRCWHFFVFEKIERENYLNRVGLAERRIEELAPQI